jgi:hypothetical protein
MKVGINYKRPVLGTSAASQHTTEWQFAAKFNEINEKKTPLNNNVFFFILFHYLINEILLFLINSVQTRKRANDGGTKTDSEFPQFFAGKIVELNGEVDFCMSKLFWVLVIAKFKN